jgi:RNA polymerase sigma factor (sigma-70 family)
MEPSNYPKKIEPPGWNADGLVDDDAHSAYMRVVRATEKVVLAYFLKHLANKSYAKDLTQDVFLKSWSNWSAFDQSKPPLPWILTIARNTLFQFIRDMKAKKRCPNSQSPERADFKFRGVPTKDGIDCIDLGTPPDAEGHISEVREGILDALAELPIKDQEYLRSYYIDAESINQIALTRRMNSQAVYSALDRARKKLKKEMKIRGLIDSNNRPSHSSYEGKE